jgi:hypothetical protein
MNAMQSRKSVRYQIGVPAFFSWKAKGRRRVGEGVTRDISAEGMFVSTSSSPPAEVQIRIEIVLPPLHTGAPPLRIRGVGKVIRTETGSATAGFALASQAFALQNGAALSEWNSTALPQPSEPSTSPSKFNRADASAEETN